MIRTVTIVPAVLTNDEATYKAELEKINTYAKRVQIDITDGVFAKSPTVDISKVWWLQGWKADLHLMVTTPSKYLDAVIKMKPSLCILHAEASENLLPIYAKLKEAGIKTGVAMLPSSYPGRVKPYIDVVDHVLIFAGKLGEQGGEADMMQMEKIGLVRKMKPEIEIGWDGGANMTNIRALGHADLDVINVGSALKNAEKPADLYHEMVAELDKSGVVL